MIHSPSRSPRPHVPGVRRTRVASLVWEDSTCRRATKAHALRRLDPAHSFKGPQAVSTETTYHNYRVHVLQLPEPVCLEPEPPSKRSHCSEKPGHRSKEQPPFTTTGESPHPATKTQPSPK
ncbi:hypothetical protein MJT46_018484 [Ovis ammon polii x Ovis aries]|nr:hypothetical protein MJT46_018484 [Ovis ammon polii x Ovis aries]